MGEQGKSNFIWWAIGGVAIVGLGASLYFYFRKPKDNSTNEKKADESKPTPTPTPAPVTTQSTPAPAPAPAPAVQAAGTTYFDTKEQGNAFRAYVIGKDPTYASSITLSPSGPKDNDTIRTAYAKYGADFQKNNSTALSLIKIGSFYKWDTEPKFGGILYKTEGNPNGNIVFEPNGRVYIFADNNGTVSKWKGGGYYFNSKGLNISIGGKQYEIPQSALTRMHENYVWQIWDNNKIWDGANQKWLPFNLTEEQARKGFADEGTSAQDSIL